MIEFIAGVVRAAIETFTFPEPILELGSYLVEGQEHLADLRRYFPEKQFTGVDRRAGPGVDALEDVENLSWGDATAGTVIALNLFEHVEHFWRGFDEMQRILRADGLLFISCPFDLHIHDYPKDYWRFTPEAFRSLLTRVPARILGYHGPRNRPLNVWAIATGLAYPAITPEQHAMFRRRIRLYAQQPLPWETRIRYRAGRLICGSGPFARYLEAETFDTQMIETRS